VSGEALGAVGCWGRSRRGVGPGPGRRAEATGGPISGGRGFGGRGGLV